MYQQQDNNRESSSLHCLNNSSSTQAKQMHVLVPDIKQEGQAGQVQIGEKLAASDESEATDYRAKLRSSTRARYLLEVRKLQT